MPYRSEAQRKYFNDNRKALQAKGVDVDEWNESSRGKKLPKKVQEPMSEIRSLAKKAAELKQANIAGQLLRATVPAVKKALPKLKSLVPTIVRPTVKPKPALVQANAGNVPGKVNQALNYVANVPKGESFLQRPVANTTRLLSLDGIPGMRRLGQAGIVSTLGTGAYKAYKSHTDATSMLDNTIQNMAPVLQLTPEQQELIRTKGRRSLWSGYSEAATVPWHRYVTGYSDDNQGRAQQAKDNLIANGINDYTKLTLRDGLKPQNSWFSTAVHNRNPVGMAFNTAVNYIPSLIERNMTYSTADDYLSNLKQLQQNTDKSKVTSGLQNNAQAIWQSLTPQQKQIILGQ